MELFTYRQYESSIVIVGSFYPLQFTPQWFVLNGLLPSEDEQSITVEIIYKELTRFTLPPISVEVTEDKLILRSSQKQYDYLIRDLAEGICNLRPDIAPTAMGLNVIQQIECLNHDFWHFMGDTLVPKGFWSELIPDSPRIGLQNLQLQANKPEEQLGYLNYSFSWSGLKNWVQLSLNNHFTNGDELREGPDRTAAKEKFDPLVILKDWELTLKSHRNVLEGLMDKMSKEFGNGRRT